MAGAGPSGVYPQVMSDTSLSSGRLRGLLCCACKYSIHLLRYFLYYIMRLTAYRWQMGLEQGDSSSSYK